MVVVLCGLLSSDPSRKTWVVRYDGYYTVSHEIARDWLGISALCRGDDDSQFRAVPMASSFATSPAGGSRRVRRDVRYRNSADR
jgi:hypothetical protein